MKNKIIVFSCCIFILAALPFMPVVSSSAFVKPSLVPPPGVWQLDFELHGVPKQISITLPGDTKPRRYWYLLYTVTNNTGKDVDFYPDFTLFTDNFKIYHAGAGVRLPVFESIRKLYRNNFPLLESEEQVSGKLLQGEDNARDCVAIFPDFDPAAHHVKIFVNGLSNETVPVENPVKIDPQTHKHVQVLLRKTLMLKYQVPGDKYDLENRVMLYRSSEWILR